MNSRPHPIGYVEIQRAFIGPCRADEFEEMLDGVRTQAAREYPGLVPYDGARLESSTDGAGVMHYVLYVGFAPATPSSEPLDPRNLNAAPVGDQIGDPARDNNIGWKENKF